MEQSSPLNMQQFIFKCLGQCHVVRGSLLVDGEVIWHSVSFRCNLRTMFHKHERCVASDMLPSSARAAQTQNDLPALTHVRFFSIHLLIAQQEWYTFLDPRQKVTSSFVAHFPPSHNFGSNQQTQTRKQDLRGGGDHYAVLQQRTRTTASSKRCLNMSFSVTITVSL